MIPSTQRFSDRVDYYVRARPKYPVALLRFFQSELGLSPVHAVADIGSGTGFLTELFVRNGNETFAVEPNDQMRSAAEQFLGEWTNFHSVTGTAEATTLADASIDFITAGQAFHWFHPKASASEFQRILRTTGVAALIWNERLTDGSPFMLGYERLIEQFRKPGDSTRSRLTNAEGEESIRTFFGSTEFHIARFENPQFLDREGLIDRIISSSYMPLPTDPKHGELLESANTLFEDHQQNQAVQVLHETRVYYGKLLR
jgi:ubiquinone/menaquinone biosynthesis C-methylase UbiE